MFLIVIVLILIYLLSKHNREHFYNNIIDKCYCINLPDNIDRWNNIKKYFHEFDIDVVKYNAIDTRTYSKMMKYKQFISKDAIHQLYNLYKNGKRDDHHELTPGAVGCYLSHLSVWYDAIKNNENYVLVLEDDTKLYSGFYEKIHETIENVPSDWDIILFGVYGVGHLINYKYNIFKVNNFVLFHCYLINVKSIKKIIDKLIPINCQVDFAVSKLSDELNIYGRHIINQSGFTSQIQIPLSINKKIFNI